MNTSFVMDMQDLVKGPIVNPACYNLFMLKAVLLQTAVLTKLNFNIHMLNTKFLKGLCHDI